MSQKPPVNNIKRAEAIVRQKSSPKRQWAISAEEQAKEIDSMVDMVKYQKFFFVVNTIINPISIDHVHGLQWLGYDDRIFSYDKYLSIIHPSFMEAIIRLAKVSFEMANNKAYKIAFHQQQYVINVALRHANGRYYLCKRALSAWNWQFDETQQNVTHYCLEFSLHEEFDEMKDMKPNTNPRVVDKYYNNVPDLEASFKKNVQDLIENHAKLFSIAELRIIRKMAYNPNITAKEIAESYKIEVATVHTANKRILEKGRRIFQTEQFNSAKDVAALMRNNFLV